VDDISRFLRQYFKYFRAKDESSVTLYDKYMGISGVLRTNVIENWTNTQKNYTQNNVRRIYYISLEYNLGSPIRIHMVSSGLEKEFEYMKKYIGISESEILSKEPLMNLGNGFIGEFSGSFLETLASNAIPAVAYGLWYGMAQFKQSQGVSGQLEMPYYWSSLYNPWIVDRPEYSNSVYFGGHLTNTESEKPSWNHDDIVIAAPVDYPVSGYHNKVVNTLRFWDAVPSKDFRSDYALHNDYIRACDDKMDSVKFLRYLFNEEQSRQTSELYIKQQYFLACASIKDIIRRHVTAQKNNIRTICDKAQIVLADCRCGLAIVEFIRILVYDFDIPIKEAVDIAKKTFVVSFPLIGNGEFPKVPLYILNSLLPQHVRVIMDMNHIILKTARESYHISDDEARDISLIEEGAMQKICMANLALMFCGEIYSYSESNAEYIKKNVSQSVLRIFDVDIKPSFSAVSLRRWLFYANKRLATLVSSQIGEKWINDNSKLAEFEKSIKDISVQNEFEKIKTSAKENFMKKIGGEPLKYPLTETLFVNHSRRMALANSQILMLFYIACRYIRIEKGENLIPRVYLFAGRALPFDFYGKQLVSLVSIFSLALQNCPKLQVRFIHNCDCTIEEELLVVGDICERVSSPSCLETVAFNMFRDAANGVITLTGINSCEKEIAAKLGENTTFGVDDKNVDINAYDVNRVFENTPLLQEAFDLVFKWIKDYSGSEEEERKLYPILYNLRSRDEMKMFAYFNEYCQAQDEIDERYKNKSEWIAMALRNVARANVGTLDKAVLSLYNDKRKEAPQNAK